MSKWKLSDGYSIRSMTAIDLQVDDELGIGINENIIYTETITAINQIDKSTVIVSTESAQYGFDVSDDCFILEDTRDFSS